MDKEKTIQDYRDMESLEKQLADIKETNKKALHILANLGKVELPNSVGKKLMEIGDILKQTLEEK